MPPTFLFLRVQLQVGRVEADFAAAQASYSRMLAYFSWPDVEPSEFFQCVDAFVKVSIRFSQLTLLQCVYVSIAYPLLHQAFTAARKSKAL